MSAASPPAPPPHLVPVRSSASVSGMDRAGGSTNGHYISVASRKRSAPKYPHVNDLIARASQECRSIEGRPLRHLLDRAETGAKSAKTLLDFRKPAQAYLEYLVAATLLSKTIPRSKDSSLLQDQPSLKASYNSTIRKINDLHVIFDDVKGAIILDNEEHGTLSASVSSAGSARPLSAQARPSSGTLSGHIATQDRRSSVDLSSQHSRLPQRPHEVRNVDEANGSGGSRDEIEQRFQKLRVHESSRHSVNGSPARVSQAMPRKPVVDAHVTRTLPKAPSPTYSPARGGAHNRNSTGSSTASVNEGHESSISSGSYVYSSVPEEVSTAATTTYASSVNSLEDRKSAGRRRRNTETMGRDVELTADRLYDYLKSFSVLLIDVRDREQYDSGHIFHRQAMCIEPAALRPNMSADDLQDALVLSPEEEQVFFNRRDEFDLVVYYDQSTASASYVKGFTDRSNLHLKSLHEALDQYNLDKPLRYPPMLLKGGLDAWIDLLGPQSLQSSTTATRRPQPIPRKSLNTDAVQINVPRRRHRDFDPLDAEEEKKWYERARSESVNMSEPIAIAQPEGGRPQTVDEEDESREAFSARYPDVASVEQRTLVDRPPSRPAPEVPRVPLYPTTPALSAPLRPAPVMARPSYSGVSDRVSTPNVPPKVPNLPPAYIPPRLNRLPRIGLHNFGVTCYMNSTIQCLSATLPLTAFFIEGKWKKHLQRDNWKGSKGVLSALYDTLLQNLWLTHDVSILRPTNFRKFCARLNREWGLDRQQDAKEFLEFLVDTLHEDLNDNWSRNPLRELTAREEATRESMHPFVAAQHEWQRYIHRDYSELTQLFCGQHISKLQCTTCRNSSTTYEAFYAISVEIPQPSSGKPVDIHDCLRSYCSEERLSGQEVWRCPHCKVDREAIKRITITRAPEFLVIHFKRFSASHSARAQKIHTAINFPLTGLDLTPYMLPSPSSDDRERLVRGTQLLEANPRSMTPPYRYNAYAVMRHIGRTMTSGHYISSVLDRARGVWREFNDDRVTDFKPEQLPHARRLQNEQAYIVFFQRESGTGEGR